MSIAELIKERQLKKDERLTVELEFLTGFQVTLAHMTPQEYNQLRNKVEKVIFVNHMPETTIDDKKLAGLLANHIVGWKGFNQRILSRMFWLKIDDLSEEEKTAEIPFTPEDGAALLLRHDGFSRWVTSNIINQDHFRSQLEGAEKNLSSGSDFGPGPDESPVTAAEPSATN